MHELIIFIYIYNHAHQNLVKGERYAGFHLTKFLQESFCSALRLKHLNNATIHIHEKIFAVLLKTAKDAKV